MARPFKRGRDVSDSTRIPDSKRPAKLKHGRQEMRKVTRTMRRDQRDEHENIDEDSEQDQDDSEEEENSEQVDAEDLNSTKTYDALLTLLKNDHKQSSSSMKPAAEKSIGEENHQGDDDSSIENEDGVAGENLEDEDDSEEEELIGSESEAEDEENDVANLVTRDAFEDHFNEVTEDYINTQEKLIKKDMLRWSISDKSKFSKLGYTSIFQTPPGELLGKYESSGKVKKYTIKKRIQDAYDKNFKDEFNELESTLLEPMLTYKDILFPYKSFKNDGYRKLYVLHTLNHIYKTRDRILKNNEKLHSYQESLKNGKVTSDSEPELRDQGFTRPKVLILLPTRNACYEVVELLIKLSGAEQQENKKKFNQQFFSKDVPPENKPEDFQHTFKGNNNDFFCIGMKFTRKSLKLYSSFYSSDIIIASPIGLSMILENPNKRKRQYDFLSSIEVLIVDKANQIEMQNWDHMNTIYKYLNKVPKDFHGADFSRIRMWYINDQASYLRQSLIFSEYITPNVSNAVTSKSMNLAGKLKFKPIITSENCIMNSVGLKLRQIFQRFESSSPAEDPEARFNFFINSIIPSLSRSTSYDDGLLIYIPSYYDYLRLKSYMQSSTKLTFGAIDEYTSQSKLTKLRQGFANGKIKVLLYTERLHYFRRFEIKGVKNIIMYGIPTNPLFYRELIRFIGVSVFKEMAHLDLSLAKVIYSKWDAVALERIVGNERAPVLCHSANEIYEFR